jgi:hypothetical protein
MQQIESHHRQILVHLSLANLKRDMNHSVLSERKKHGRIGEPLRQRRVKSEGDHEVA